MTDGWSCTEPAVPPSSLARAEHWNDGANFFEDLLHLLAAGFGPTFPLQHPPGTYLGISRGLRRWSTGGESDPMYVEARGVTSAMLVRERRPSAS